MASSVSGVFEGNCVAGRALRHLTADQHHAKQTATPACDDASPRRPRRDRPVSMPTSVGPGLRRSEHRLGARPA